MPRPIRLFESKLPSGNAYKVSLLLAQLGISVDVVALDTMATPSQTRLPAFLAKNPNGRIPLLELDDGTFLPESNAILYFLATGTPFLPDEPLARARALAWMFFEQYSHEPYVAVLKFWTLWGGLEHKRSDELAHLKQRGQAAIDVMERHLESAAWFTGARYGIADIALYAYTQAASSIGFSIGPAVDGWLARVRDRPGHVALRAT